MFLALSTYFIAKAGESLVSEHISHVQYFITLFFITALIAYFLSSCAEWFEVKLKNYLWENYVFDSFEKIKLDQQLSSRKNQLLTTSWLTGEAPATFDDISSFSVGFISIYCNVIFTLIVFGLTLGLEITAVMTVSLAVSIILVSLLKEKITNLANDIQNSKLSTLTQLNFLWDTYLFGNNHLIKLAHDNSQFKIKSYFKNCENYVMTEQILACLPIYIAIPIVITTMFLTEHTNASLGIFVAVLPRSLQLFGNVHSLSIYNSKFVFMKQKLKNLRHFILQLEKQDLKKQIQLDKIRISDIHKQTNIPIRDFLNKINENELKQGRFLITGSNGSGKSSLLKSIKLTNKEAILISPDASLVSHNSVHSSGERQLQQFNYAFSQDVDIFLLDEWDANLDSVNVLKAEEKINIFSKKALIIEVRHKSNSR